jgi:hypothetical protein
VQASRLLGQPGWLHHKTPVERLVEHGIARGGPPDFDAPAGKNAKIVAERITGPQETGIAFQPHNKGGIP